VKNPYLWMLAIGGGAVVGVMLITRRAKAASYGEKTRVPLAVPAGWRRVTNAEVTALPELGDRAVALRSYPGFATLPYGSLYAFTASNGNTYALWVEQHYHKPGGSLKPWGYHHGVTVLAKVG